MRRLLARSKLATFAYRYAVAGNRYERRAAVAIDGPSWVKRRLWKRYLTPDPSFKPVTLSPTYAAHLEAMRTDGICYIKGFTDVATKLRELISSYGLSEYRRQDRVTDFEIDAGFIIPEVLAMLTDPNLCGLLCNYYGRQAFYREHPLIVGMSAGNPGVDRSSSQVHCDGYRQITLHLLLNDITADDTHLVYFKGSQKVPKVDYTRVTEHAQQTANYDRALGIGKAGTLVLFESGSGYHQGRYLTGQRLLLSGVVTTGWLPFRDPAREDLDALRTANLAPHVRQMFMRL